MKRFEDALSELGIPEKHSIFEIASGKTGYGLMSREEAVKYALQGKDINWFVREFKERYYRMMMEQKYR